MKKYLYVIIPVLLIGLFIFVAYKPANVVNLHNDSAVTSTNDTLTGSWKYIANAEDVEIFMELGDSISYLTRVDFYTGTSTSYASYTLSGSDTTSNLASPTIKGQGKVLKGFTANNIAGASSIRVVHIRKDYSTAHTSSIKTWMVTR